MRGCKLSSCAFGLAFGILWGVAILLMGFAATYYAYGQEFIHSMSALYPGYAPSIKGSFLGAAIAFIDAFIMGFLLAWLYNRFASCNCVCCGKEEEVVVKRARKKA